MQRRTHHALLALALLVGCARARESASTPEDTGPPSTFLEAQPNQIDSPNLDYLTVSVVEGLVITLHAKPLSLAAGGWGFELDVEFENQLATHGVFDLGPEPMVSFSISVTLPDGTGFGSGGGCTYGSNLHGHKEQALEPGEFHTSSYMWTAGVEAGQVLAAGISLCHIQLPDGSSFSGEIARIDAVVDAEGRLAKFELRKVVAPNPRP